MSYFRLQNRIRELLIEYPETRDNDNALIAFLLMDMDFLNLKQITAQDFLMNLKNGDYGSVESITRCRRKLQEKNPDLRGEIWEKRHGYKSEVEAQLKFDF